MRDDGHSAVRAIRREDFALERVPSDIEAPGTASLFGVMLAIPSALVFLSVGGSLGLAYGTRPLVVGLVLASCIIGLAGWVLTAFSRRSGLDSDLMSIVAGFGRVGSGFTSAIYSANFLILFALEDAIVAGAIHSQYPGIPKWLVLCGLGAAVLALTWHGVAALARVMWMTLPVFLCGVVIASVHLSQGPSPAGSFWSYSPPQGVDGIATLSVLAALLAFVVNATVAADVGRFLPESAGRTGEWLFGGVLQVVTFGGATLLGAWLTWQSRGNADPGLYLPALLGPLGLVCVILSQTRINLINAYSGSLSLSNFGARLFGARPGRHVWMATLVCAGTILAMGDIYSHLLGVLTFEAVFVMAWVAALVTYIILHKPPPRRGSVSRLESAPAMNWIGMSALSVALMFSVPMAFGAAGVIGRSLAPLVAVVVAATGVVVASRLSVVAARATRTE